MPTKQRKTKERVMYNDNKDIIRPLQEREDLYLGLIGECKKRVDQIRSKITIITCPTVSNSNNQETPNRTELEAELKALLNKLRELENDIVV